jgi:hypothetical protein
MGLLAAIVVCFVGIVLSYSLNSLPAASFSSFVPVCWIPGVDCPNQYNNVKMYLVVIVVTLIAWFL